MAIKILALAGSTREGSFNKKLVRIAAEGARQAGAEVTLADLRDFPMPVFDQDLQDKEGLPESTVKLKKLMLASDGFLLATPEYNGGIPGVLKNAIDWTSRREPGEESELHAFKGKVVVLMSASDGRFGGVRSLFQLVAVCYKMGMLILPQNFSLSFADEAFSKDDTLKDPEAQKIVTSLGKTLTDFLKKQRPV